MSTLSASWRRLRSLLEDFIALFETPARLAAKTILYVREHDALLAWLRALERLARLLLLAQAAALILPPSRARRARVKYMSFRRPVYPSPDQSHTWRAPFRALPPGRTWAPGSRPSRPIPPQSPRSLAHRVEALIRVALAPDAFARRLARRLMRRGLSRRVSAKLFRRPGRFPIEQAIGPALALARPGRARFESG